MRSAAVCAFLAAFAVATWLIFPSASPGPDPAPAGAAPDHGTAGDSSPDRPRYSRSDPRPADDRLFVGRYGVANDPKRLVPDLVRHVQILPEIHERYVEEFTLSWGFG